MHRPQGTSRAIRGRLAEARPVLDRAIHTKLCPETAAHNCRALARVAALQGDLAEFERMSQLGP
ncbi:MAG: hypothetical protein U0931_28305 [Vulcanimicrobiota bacterium]